MQRRTRPLRARWASYETDLEVESPPAEQPGRCSVAATRGGRIHDRSCPHIGIADLIKIPRVRPPA
jgi:hypothetical protein